MALLPFLGAGQTHIAGDYQQVVGNGLDALLRQMKVKKNGGSFEDGGVMYSHGLASIALCEAYGMTDDPRLQQPAQAALNYIVYAQDPQGGGWRYSPRTPGDTSVVGWQIMALKSGHMSYLNVPYSTVRGATYFLDRVQVNGGTGYAYVTDELNYRPGTSAIGLLCRMYLGWKRDNEILKQGVARIAKTGPSNDDFYYNYYAAQLMFQFTNAEGEMWETWNNKLRDQLVASQDKQGHAKGSWLSQGGHGIKKGGRLMCTSLGTMTLEVYYRHMPLYRSETVEAEFPE